MYDAVNSIYCYKGTNVLINKLDIKDSNVLLEYEKRIVALKLIALHKQGITGDFDVNHFVSIHRFLFEDIYPFAGKFRLENIAKDNFRFAEFQYIESELNRLLNKLKNDNYLSHSNIDMAKSCSTIDICNLNDNDVKYKMYLAQGIAYYWAELNVLHPFREGNGRTTREFLRQLALKNGYSLDIHNIDANKFLEASKKSIVDDTDLANLVYMSLKLITN